VRVARDSAGTEWYLKLRVRNATDGRDDPKEAPTAGSDEA
jgi:hypothetical protein